MRTHLLGWALASIAIAGSISAQSLVAPTGYAGVEGDSNNAFPWNRGASSMRAMQVYDSSNFTTQGANGPLLITRLRFRADATSSATWTGGTYGSVEVRMSTCPVDHTAVSTTFDSNHGVDVSTVHSGSLTIDGGTNSTPGPWHVNVVLDHPFVYNPANGDLTVDILLDGTTYGGGTLVQCDAVSSTATPAANGSRVFSTAGVNPATGTVGVNYALVCEFDYQRLHDLTTTFAGGNGNSSGGGVYFDVGVNCPEGIDVNALGLNVNSPVSTAGTLDVYIRPGTSTGFEQSPAGWRQVAVAVPYVASGPGVETKVAIPPLVLPRGIWGFCVVCTNPGLSGQSYTNGANVYSDAAITLTTGTANNVALSAGTVNSPRSWNGTFYYQGAGRKVPTIFTGGTIVTTTPGTGIYFDAFVRPASGVRLTSLEVNHNTAGADTVSIWQRAGTAAGNETSPVGWRQVVNALPFTSLGGGRPSQICLPYPILLAAGTNGLALSYGTGQSLYNAGNGTNENYTDGIVDVLTKSSSVAVLAPGTVFSPRVWNGVLHYQVVDPDVLQLQFNEPYAATIGNSAVSTALPREGSIANAIWQGDPGRPAFRGNEPGAGMLARTATTGNNIGSIGWAPLTGDMTIAWWQRMGPTPPVSTAYSCGTVGGTSERIFTGGVAGTSLWYRGSPIGDITANSSVQASPGVWRHIALTIDNAAGVARWYFDGELDATRTFTPLTHQVAGTALNVGYQASTGSAFTLSYDMDDFRVYNQALTEAEVKVLMQGENASAGTYGTPCGLGSISGRGGMPSATSGNPAFAVQLTGSNPNQLYISVLGFLPRSTGPVNIAPFFGPGCFFQTTNQSSSFGLTNAGGNATVSLPVPRNPGLVGLHVYSQFLVWPLGAGAATRGLDVSLK